MNKDNLIHRGRVFDIYTEKVALPNDVTTDLDIIRHPGASAIVPYVDEDKILMIRQYRYCVGGYIWEIPAGTLESGESPEACAKRELTEETGYTAKTWNKLGVITPVPAYSDEKIHLYMAGKLTKTLTNLDEDEIIDVHQIPMDQAVAMIMDGRIQDAKTISAILMAGQA